MSNRMRKVYISEFPARGYHLTSPLEVYVHQQPNGRFKATAPELGMWRDGFGKTEAEAIDALCDAIMDILDSAGDSQESLYSEYAMFIKRDVQRRFVGK